MGAAVVEEDVHIGERTRLVVGGDQRLEDEGRHLPSGDGGRGGEAGFATGVRRVWDRFMAGNQQPRGVALLPFALLSVTCLDDAVDDGKLAIFRETLALYGRKRWT